MPRRSNNGRFTRQTKTRRRSPRKTNLVKIGEQYLIADAISRGMFNTNLLTFLGIRNDFQGQYNSGNNSNEITARELIDLAMGGSGGITGTYWAGGLPQVLKSNLRANAPMMVASVVAIPLAFKVGSKLLRKPILTPANRMLKAAGLTGVKV